jgi:hypothetical protein
MQPEAQKLQGKMPDVPRKHVAPVHFSSAMARWVKESFLPALAMSERGVSTFACRKAGVGCKYLGGIEWAVDPDS